MSIITAFSTSTLESHRVPQSMAAAIEQKLDHSIRLDQRRIVLADRFICLIQINLLVTDIVLFEMRSLTFSRNLMHSRWKPCLQSLTPHVPFSVAHSTLLNAQGSWIISPSTVFGSPVGFVMGFVSFCVGFLGDWANTEPTTGPIEDRFTVPRNCRAIATVLLAHRPTRRNLREFATTLTDESAMAAAAMMGESSIPKKGYSIPAATGTPNAL